MHGLFSDCCSVCLFAFAFRSETRLNVKLLRKSLSSWWSSQDTASCQDNNSTESDVIEHKEEPRNPGNDLEWSGQPVIAGTPENDVRIILHEVLRTFNRFDPTFHFGKYESEITKRLARRTWRCPYRIYVSPIAANSLPFFLLSTFSGNRGIREIGEIIASGFSFLIPFFFHPALRFFVFGVPLFWKSREEPRAPEAAPGRLIDALKIG